MNRPRLRRRLQVLPHKPTGAAFAKFLVQLCAVEIQASAESPDYASRRQEWESALGKQCHKF